MKAQRRKGTRPVFYFELDFETPFIVTQQSSSDSSTEREIIKRAVYIIVCVSKEQKDIADEKAPKRKGYVCIQRNIVAR
jgi:hypothetical protein